MFSIMVNNILCPTIPHVRINSEKHNDKRTVNTSLARCAAPAELTWQLDQLSFLSVMHFDIAAISSVEVLLIKVEIFR